MALIECPDCGQQVSTNAVACPHCGNPILRSTQSSVPALSDPPTPSAQAPFDPAPATRIRFRPLAFGLTGTTAGFWWAAAAAYALIALLYFLTWGTWLLYVDGETTGFDLINMEETATGAFGLVLVFTWICGVLFIIWLYQAYKSAESLGAVNRSWGPGWTVGSWFIPLANLVLPKLVVNEVDRMANPSCGTPPIEQRWKSQRRLVSSDLWWIALLGGQIVTTVGWVTYYSGPTYEDDLTGAGYLVIMAGMALYAATAALAGVVTMIIGRRLRPDRAGLASPRSAL